MKEKLNKSMPKQNVKDLDRTQLSKAYGGKAKLDKELINLKTELVKVLNTLYLILQKNKVNSI